MKKILIGVSAPNNETTKAAIAQLSEVFTLNHLNMRQPMINMIAALTEIDKTAQEFYCPQDYIIDHPGISIEQLEISLSLTLRTFKRDFYINHCADALAHARRGYLGQLFSGQIISGIKTELEAQWIREQGGQMAQLNKTYDLKTAAAMFGMSHIEFYKMLRGECTATPLKPSWICAGTYSKDPNNNAPKEWAKKAGYLSTETRGRPAPYNAYIAINYNVTVLTEHGIMALEKILNKNALPPKPLALTAQNAQVIQAKPVSQASQQEREKLLAEFNLPIYPAKAS